MVEAEIPSRFQQILKAHTDTTASFVEAIRRLPNENWTFPAGEKKWTTAHIVEHLTKVYEVLLSELNSGPGMRLLTNKPTQWILRWAMLRRILSGNYFPKGARAPREVRPATALNDRDKALELFEDMAGRFHDRIRQAHQENPKAQLTHAYFGKMCLPDVVLLCAKHIQHHQRQLIAS